MGGTGTAPPWTSAWHVETFGPQVKYVLLRLKREQIGWGPDTLRLALQRRASLAGQVLPGRSAVYAYLRPFQPRLRARCRLRTRRPSHTVNGTGGPSAVANE